MARVRSILVPGVVTAVAAAGLAVGVGAPAAQAASGPGTWVQLSSGGGVANIVDPAVHRFGKTLQVVWIQQASTKTALRTRVVAVDGSAASGIRTVLTWASLNEFPAVISAAGKRTIVFSGIQDTNSSNPYSVGYGYYATSTDGLTWTLANGTLGSSTSAYASYGLDATNAGGTPLSVFTAATASRINYHAGFEALPPANADGQTANTGCCTYYAGVAYDAQAGKAWTAWYSNSGAGSTDGIDAQPIYPTLGSRVHAPSSTSSYGGSISSVEPGQRVQVAARSGGGLFTAYGIGYPTQRRVALWRLGSSTPLSISAGHEIRSPGVASAPGGRMWLFWWQDGTSTLKAVRTNPGATRFGAVCSVRTPHGTTSVWKTAGDGSNGRLDLVVNAGDGSGEQIYSTQVLPCLTGRVSPAKISSSTGGTVTITVTDAGSAVADARVAYNGVVKYTDQHGQASFHVARGTSTGTHAVSYGHGGYTGGKATFKVT